MTQLNLLGIRELSKLNDDSDATSIPKNLCGHSVIICVLGIGSYRITCMHANRSYIPAAQGVRYTDMSSYSKPIQFTLLLVFSSLFM